MIIYKLKWRIYDEKYRKKYETTIKFICAISYRMYNNDININGRYICNFMFGKYCYSSCWSYGNNYKFFKSNIKTIQVSNNVIIARAIGNNDNEKIKKTTGTAVYLGIAFQCICILLTISFSHFIPTVFKVDNICLIYLYIRIIGTIPSAISTIISGYLRTIRNV